MAPYVAVPMPTSCVDGKRSVVKLLLPIDAMQYLTDKPLRYLTDKPSVEWLWDLKTNDAYLRGEAGGVTPSLRTVLGCSNPAAIRYSYQGGMRVIDMRGCGDCGTGDTCLTVDIPEMRQPSVREHRSFCSIC